MSPTIKEVGIVNVTTGENVTIVQPSNLYHCHLADDVFIGPFVEVQAGVKIGCGTRVQSHSFICELVEVGEHCTIAHGVMFINDPFSIGGPARGDKALWRSTKIGNHVSIGSNATIMPVSICDEVVIGAGAVVTKDIIVPGIYAGNPAKLIRS